MPNRADDCTQELETLTTPVEEGIFLSYGDMSFLLPLEDTTADDLTCIALPDTDEGLLDSPRIASAGGIDETLDEDADLDLSPGAADKSNDPVRVYMREMAAVPLLTREGEVVLARRIERGRL